MNSRQRSKLRHIAQKFIGLRKPRQEPEGSNSDSQQPTEPLNITEAAIKPKPDAIGTVVSPPSSNNNKKEWREKWKFRIEVSGAFILLIYSGFAGWQACEMRKANKATVHALMTDQRARVSFSGFKLSNELKVGSDFSITGSVINTGKTPAISATTTIERYFSSAETIITNPDNPARPSGELTNLFVLTPNVIAEFQTIGSRPVTSEQMRQYTDPKGYLLVQQTVWYWDIFGKPHWIRTCRWHRYNRPYDEFGFCGWNNATDHNDPQ